MYCLCEFFLHLNRGRILAIISQILYIACAFYRRNCCFQTEIFIKCQSLRALSLFHFINAVRIVCYVSQIQGISMRRQELHPRTAVINKTQKNQSKNARTKALVWLASTFPQVFDNTVCIRPLKAGIMEDILAHAEKAVEHGISRSKIREAVVLFTRRIDYLACLKSREMRVDLDGNPVTPVTDEEAEKAAQKIKKRIEKSVKNARKTTVSSPVLNQYGSRTSSSKNISSAEFNPHHVERPPMFSAQSATAAPSKPAVIVKHKSSRQYDPDAVARLKEKLGLSRKAEKETTV